MIAQRKALTKLLIWLAAEIALNLLGLDELADYSEFVFQDKVWLLGKQALIV